MKEDLKLKRGNLMNITIYGNRKRTEINRGKKKEGGRMASCRKLSESLERSSVVSSAVKGKRSTFWTLGGPR